VVSVAAPPVLDTSPAPPAIHRRRKIRWGRWILLTLTGIYFLIPLYAAIKFALTKTNGSGFSFAGVTGIFSVGGFGAAVALSARLAVVTLVITLVLMVPTAVFVHLRLPKLRTLFDGITLLPIVIPPVILIVGVLQVAPTSLKATPYLLSLEYAVLAMPFAYRSLDAGLAAIDLKTMVEASRSLGSGWLRTMLQVVVPNLRTAILSATVLTVALVLGEYTMASFDLQTTFSVWIYNTDQGNAHVSTSASLLALIATWVLLVGIVSVGSRKKGTGRLARRRAAQADRSSLRPSSPSVASGPLGGQS
jgi:putative spermidine/putrescine transport system permease protein